MKAGVPNIENKSLKQAITVLELKSAVGYANGNLEYSSIIVRRYLLFEFVGSGPLKSILNRSNGWVALINVFLNPMANLGFSSEHILQLLTACFISSTE